MKPYSADLRERLLGAIDAGLPQVEAARLVGVSVSSLKRWRTPQRQTGSLVARRRTGRHRRVRPEQEASLRAQVAATPDATLAEHCAAWAATTGIHLSTATMSRTLARLDQPQKKSP